MGIDVRSDVIFKHLGRDWAVEWLLQLIVVVEFVLIDFMQSASAPISSSVSPLSL